MKRSILLGKSDWRRNRGRSFFIAGALLALCISASAQSGADWTRAIQEAPWAGRGEHASAVHDGKIWIMGGGAYGYTNDVWSSPDGVNWTRATAEAPWSARRAHSAVTYDGKIWIMGGGASASSRTGGGWSSDVWSSTDGVDWTRATEEAPWRARMGHTSAVHDGKIWVMGGVDASGRFLNDVWSSTDGVTWTEVTSAAGWAPRLGHACVVHDGKIWVMGGGDSAVLKNDVWSSSDGANWIQVTGAAPWSVRRFPAAAIHGGRIWIIGGAELGGERHDTGYKNDVWSSSDGSSWRQETESAPWTGRSGMAGVAHDGKLWLLGGSRGIRATNSEVWFLADGAN